MLKKSASGVLASLRGSTYRSVRLASSLAAALLDGHFEHPAWRLDVALHIEVCESFRGQRDFFTAWEIKEFMVKGYCQWSMVCPALFFNDR
jgi:hypothetical protein